MNNNNHDGTLFKLIGFGLLLYAGVLVVKSVAAAITALLMGLVNIALVAGGILALFFVYRYITRKLPRQVDSSKVEVLAVSRSRNNLGGNPPSASCGRSSLYAIIHHQATSLTSSRFSKI